LKEKYYPLQTFIPKPQSR